MDGSLGTVAYDIVAKDKTAEGLTSAGDRAQKVGKAVGVGMTVVGASLTLLTDKAKKMQAPIRMTALQLGATTKEIRDLALETTNVTFPLEEVTASFDLLTRAGMTNKDAIAATATAFDTLGDATGKTASQITTMMVPAFNAFNIPLEDANEYVDLFTHLQRTTTIELESFSGMVNYLAADLDTMDLSLENSIAVMEALADKGIQGSSATREFRTAVTAADGDVVAFYEALGLTEAEIGRYTDKLAEAEGMTNEYAAAANTQYGTVDKLKQKVSELTLEYGALLEPLDTLGPILTGLGPMILAFTVLQTSAAAAGTTLTASIWMTTAALLANPLTWVAIAVVGLVAVLFILEKKFGVLTKASNILSDAVHRLVDWFKDKLTPAIEFVHTITAKFGDKLLFLLGPIGAVIWGLRKLHSILKDNETALEDATTATEDLEDAAGDLENATDDLAKAQQLMADSAEKVDVLTTSYEDLEMVIESIQDLMESQEDQARAIEHAEWGLKDAQEDYNEAVKEHGKDSDEAARADLRVRDAVDRLDDAQQRQKDIIEEIAEADIEKQRILSENNAKTIEELKEILELQKEIYAELEIAASYAEHILTETPALTEEKMESYQHGGTIPGPIGMPVPIIAHGGEEFLGVGGSPTGGDTFNFGPITISNDYDVERMWTKLQELIQTKRMKRGITTI